jgi:phenylacetate-CoA ligase
LQNEKLRRRVVDGYHNAPIVRELWDDAGVRPDDVLTIEDLAEAPVFRKDNARQRQIETGEPYGGRLCKPVGELDEDGAFLCTSSGTTGTSTNVAFSARDLDVLSECFARGLWGIGLRPGETLLSMDLTYHYIGKTAPRAAQRIGALTTQVHHSPAEVPRLIHVLEYLEPSSIVFLSPPIKNAVNDYLAEHDLDPKAVWESVDGIFYGGEPLIDAAREEIESEWGITVYEWAGGLEPGWFNVECDEHGRWLHVNSDHFFVEARDPETGEQVPEEERGELVVTALSYDAMSHLCWAHDDVVEIRRGICDCGRTGARVKFIGRVDDLVTVQGRDLLPYDVLPVVHEFEQLPDNLFQFYPDSTESLWLRLGYDEDTVGDVSSLVTAVTRDLEDALGVPVEVVDTMPESKLRGLGPDHKVPRIVRE